MGHERIGTLPRTVPWRQVVGTLEQAAAGTEADVAAVAGRTLQLVRARYCELYRDPGVQAAFGFLVAVARAQAPTAQGRAAPDLSLPSDASPLRLISALNFWVEGNAGSREYAELAKRSAAEAISRWNQQHIRQGILFPAQELGAADKAWAKTATAATFSEVSRVFFASFTERYIKYFLEREASSAIHNIDARDRFNQHIHASIQTISQHAFETSKIAQSFSAGWYNNHAVRDTPTNARIASFLRIAFNKIGEELRREALT